MANPEHLEILTQGVGVWNQWRRKHPSIRPNLTDTNLRRIDLKNANLVSADVRLAILREADLSSADLDAADLSAANLNSANLGGAALSSARLSTAKVMKANLMDADLTGANFYRANLDQANLNGAILKGANLTNVQLGQAKLARSVMGGTVLAELDLSVVDGLDKVEHVGPSHITTGTLYKSQGKISEIFLRGVGLPEAMIDYLPSLVALGAIENYSCFISYSHADKSFAQRLYDHLQARGVRCWLDEHNLKPGDRILDVVNDAIRLHDKILLCCSESSLESWWVKDEIRKAQERERRDGRDIIIPLMVDRYLLDGWENGMAADLRSRLAADFTGWERDSAKFKEQFERVAKALRADEGTREKPSEP